MPKFSFNTLKAEYAHMWAHMEINHDRVDVAQRKAQKIIEGRDTYEDIEEITGVPWYFIGLLHLRESNCDFDTHLHNGDPLSAKTKHVPANRPPGDAPFDFVYSAVDAIKLKKYHKITDWSIERILHCLEMYNGFGYRYRNRPSAYLWASSNQYKGGKFVKDGPKGWRPNVWDTQLGAAVVLKCLTDIVENRPEPEAPIIVDDEAPNTPTADVKKPSNIEMRQVSRKWRLLDFIKWLTGFGGTATGVTTALDAAQIKSTKSYLDAMKAFISDYGAFVAIAACVVAFLIVVLVMEYMKEDAAKGRYIPSGGAEGA